MIKEISYAALKSISMCIILDNCVCSYNGMTDLTYLNVGITLYFASKIIVDIIYKLIKDKEKWLIQEMKQHR